MRIFHIIEENEWEKAKELGHYSPKSLSLEGFIHFSHTDQILKVANSFYKDKPKLLLLSVDVDKLESEVKEEPPLEAPLSGVNFPHLYGKLNLDAVDDVFSFDKDQSGNFILPIHLTR